MGIKLFDKNDNKVYESALKHGITGYPSQETILKDGERIVGMQSRTWDNDDARHDDF